MLLRRCGAMRKTISEKQKQRERERLILKNANERLLKKWQKNSKGCYLQVHAVCSSASEYKVLPEKEAEHKINA